ncbi:MAG: hypothetical protein LBG17_04695 [Bacteroidales bacterium]|jgi:hypothetical protein|nr:hypothetical protein [Bacteroidales bacterium]
MLIEPNGYIEIKRRTPDVLDEDGYPVKESNVTYSNPIPCRYTAIKQNLQAISKDSGSPFILAKWEIFIEGDDLSCMQDCEHIRLTNSNGVLIHESSFTAEKALHRVGIITITL